MFYYSLVRYQNYYAGEFDLGHMVQVVYNTLHGHFFMLSSPEKLPVLVSRASDHFDISLLLLVPFFYIYPHVSLFLFIQSIVVALGGIFIYKFALDNKSSRSIAVFLTVIYLIMPGMLNALMFDYHPEVLASTFLLGSFYFLYKRKIYYSIPFILLALISKEDMGFILGTIGIYFTYVYIRELIKDKSKRNLIKVIFTTTLILISFSYSLIVIGCIVPLARGGHESMYLGSYGYLHGGVIAILTHPWIIFEQIDIAKTIGYTFALTAPVGFLNFLSPITLLALPEYLLDVLSSNHALQNIHFHYAATIEPFIMLGAIDTLFKLKEYFEIKKIRIIYIFFIAFSFIAMYLYSPVPISRSYTNFFIPMYPAKDINELNYLARSIPVDAVVSAPNTVGVHFTQRENIYVYPVDVPNADYVITDTNPVDIKGYTNIYSGKDIWVYKKI